MHNNLSEEQRKQYYSDFIEAGRYAKQVLQYGAQLITIGASYTEIIQQIYAKIRELGVLPAFPPQMAISNVAAHFMVAPGQDYVFTDHDIVKLDVGISVNGAIGDNAMTVDLSGKYDKLVQASRAAVEAAVDMMEIGVSLHDVGATIQSVIESHGFKPVRNLSGHGLGPFTVHQKPTIPNFANGDQTLIEPNMTFACEPFATTGVGLIKESSEPAWIFAMKKRGSVRDPLAKKIMQEAEKCNGLPFSLFELNIPQVPLFKLRVAISQLVRAGILEDYPPLIEQESGIVSQAEHSVLFDADGNKIVTTR